MQKQFERITQKYSGEWLPLYYAAYRGINSLFFDMKSVQNEVLLTEAEDCIKKLRGFPQADPSEINTLQAYSLTVRVASNPQANGQNILQKLFLSTNRQ